MKRVLCPKCDNYITLMKPNIQKASRWSLYVTIVKTIQHPYRKVQTESNP